MAAVSRRGLPALLVFALAWLPAVAAIGAITPLAAAMAATAAPAADRVPEAAIPVALLPSPATLASLRETGLVGSGAPVAAFAWTLEVERPLREPRLVSERFLGSPAGELAGLSPMLRHYGPEIPVPGGPAQPTLSVRGLTRLQPGEDRLDALIRGLKLPLVEGAVFQLDWDDEGAQLEQHCAVGASESASGLHPALPGELRRIACEGEGRYRGIPVRVKATVLYLERLGVFVRSESRIRTPLGPLNARTRIVGFEMSGP